MCVTPMTLRHKVTGEWNTFPCGKCHECLKRRASAWSFRLMQEEKHSLNALFVTLTYNTIHVPLTKKGYMSLFKPDVQNFFKRLRKIEKNKVRYYLVGEYGTERMRPHYHAIIYNTSYIPILQAWRLDGQPIGEVFFGTVTGASVGYVLKYMTKAPVIPLHRNDDRLKEFSLMSKGLGKAYLTDAMMRWHKADLTERMYVAVQDKKISMCRYYKDHMYTDEERDVIAAAYKERFNAEMDDITEETIRTHDFEVEKKMERDFINLQKMYKNAVKNRNRC